MATRSGAGHNKSRQHHCAPDHHIGGGGISVPGSQAWSGLANADCRARGSCAQQSSKSRVRAASAKCLQSCAAGFHDKLPKWACDIVCDHLPYDRRPSGASLSFTGIGFYFVSLAALLTALIGLSRILSRRSFSNGYCWRLVHRNGLGDSLLGANGVASARRHGRVARSGVAGLLRQESRGLWQLSASFCTARQPLILA